MKRTVIAFFAMLLCYSSAFADSPFTGSGVVNNNKVVEKAPFTQSSNKLEVKSPAITVDDKTKEEIKTKDKVEEKKVKNIVDKKPVPKKYVINKVKKKAPVSANITLLNNDNVPELRILTPNVEDIAKVKAMETMLYVAVSKYGVNVDTATEIGTVKSFSGSGYTAILVPIQYTKNANMIFSGRDNVVGELSGNLGTLYVVKD